ncbi:hypothetical protein EJ08DRAFT_469051 [Tothia fuscella]|uniref:Nuclear speckle splicing regulatory protein 1 N-terminal domain-containing protein n=1 Tax=Tothia fuscella TaxID=1048955 RepID=A0A9P4P037_9PEZI|nr:hypothetical protein EJ08DRAFT_469051 [Tothia fuscella]
MSFKFGLNTQKKPQSLSSKPKATVGKAKLAFGGDSDDDDQSKDDDALEIGGLPLQQLASSNPLDKTQKPSLKTNSKKLPISQFGDLSSQRNHRKNAEAAIEVDASIYDYDAAYDAIHARDAAKKAAARKEAEERKSKYMDNLLVAAETRKKDILRAKDKQLQREREAEGEEFADKEKFVTSAYKQQQEEVRIAEAEEKKRQEAEEKKKKAMGMQGFYKNMMNQQESRYQEALAATEEAEKTGIVVKLDQEKTDIELAKEMEAKGAHVTLNDEGQIVDKRQLLTAGLNIKKPKAAPKPVSTAKAPVALPHLEAKKASHQAMRERQTRMMEAQLEQSAKRAADDEAEDHRKLEHQAKSRKTEADIGSAKERYLARKKAAAEAAKKGKDGAA